LALSYYKCTANRSMERERKMKLYPPKLDLSVTTFQFHNVTDNSLFVFDFLVSDFKVFASVISETSYKTSNLFKFTVFIIFIFVLKAATQLDNLKKMVYSIF
jgi:hypothetical protein